MEVKESQVDGQSKDLVAENIEKLKELFPQIVVEDKVNFDQLKNLLGEYVDDTSNENYVFKWYGKSQSFKNSQRRVTSTLRFCEEDSKNVDTTENLYIEGDNLEVLKLLQKSYFNSVKMIYIDPPYNLDKDFIYSDKWNDSIKAYKIMTGQMDYDGNTLDTEQDKDGGRHSKWLSMMYPRLLLARNLLKKDGVIFISIDDVEVANLRRLCDDVFGEENFVTTIHIELSATQGMKVKAAKQGNIVKNAEYILIYTKNGNKNIAKNLLYDFRQNYDSHYSKYLLDDLTLVNLKDVYLEKFPTEKSTNLTKMYNEQENFRKFVLDNLDKIFADDKITGFNISDFEVDKVYIINKNNREYYIINNGLKLRQLLPLKDSFGDCDDFLKSHGLRKIRGDWWKEFYKDMGNVTKEGDIKFENGKKPVRLIKQLIKMCTDSNDICLDFFSGSATTAHAIMELNAEDGGKRKHICVQIPENLENGYNNSSEKTKSQVKVSIDFLESINKPKNICEIGKERIRRAGEKIKKEIEQSNSQLKLGEEPIEIPDIGFKVLKLDTSNLARWNLDVGEVFNNMSKVEQDAYLSEQLDLKSQNIENERTEIDLVYEVMQKFGVKLCRKVNTLVLANTNVYEIGDGALFICLDTKLTTDLAIAIIEKVKEIQPDVVRVVVRDLGFVKDSHKTDFRATLTTGIRTYFKESPGKSDMFEYVTI